MTFRAGMYAGLEARRSHAQDKLFQEYQGSRGDFDYIIIGSGIGGGLLADALAEKLPHKRILLLEAGSYLFPTHVYNVCRFSNAEVADRYECNTFWQRSDHSPNHDQDAEYIHERPQLAFGGRSIFWSGLVPTIQQWELDFFPEAVRRDLTTKNGLHEAGIKMNVSKSLGETAEKLVKGLGASELSRDFRIEQTPRALHQPYLGGEGSPKKDFPFEPTGVFNTAELLINQLGWSQHRDWNGNGFFALLNRYVEDIYPEGGGYQLVARNTVNESVRFLWARKIVLACGSIESPKLLQRSTLQREHLSDDVKQLVGRGLTDHPTTDSVWADVTHVKLSDTERVPLPSSSHAKIILYSQGKSPNGYQEFPFNVEMNVNHEWWHHRNNDPDEIKPLSPGTSRVDIKFSFANCLDDRNVIEPAPPFQYVPELRFQNLHWTSHLQERFRRLAGWNKSDQEIWNELNSVASRVFSRFERDGQPVFPSAQYGQDHNDFGWGTVHHAVGTLRMPYRSSRTAAFNTNSVVDENLELRGAPGVYVCDMSVMPISTAANPVRTLAALALRLARHLH